LERSLLRHALATPSIYRICGYGPSGPAPTFAGADLKPVFWNQLMEETMDIEMKAIEVTGTVDEQGQLHLDEPLTILGPRRIRAILLFPEGADIDEREWLQAAVSNPAFHFLKDRAEDIYTLTDGKPFHDEG
jgi:hypothetical protein